MTVLGRGTVIYSCASNFGPLWCATKAEALAEARRLSLTGGGAVRVSWHAIPPVTKGIAVALLNRLDWCLRSGPIATVRDGHVLHDWLGEP